MMLRPRIIHLLSTTLSRSELEAGLSLIRAFFPEGKVQVEEVGVLEGEPSGSREKKKLDKLANEEDKFAAEIELNFIASEEYPVIYGKFYSQHERLIRAEVTLSSQHVKRILTHPEIGKESERKLILKHGLFHLLSQVTGHTPPWGILTGIRPSKILHRLDDLVLQKDTVWKSEESSPNRGSFASEAFQAKVLRDRYAIREEKIQLLQEIVAVQQPYLKEIMEHPEQVAVYVGIPFCPTRCTYCSFPAYSLQQGREPLKAYLEGLYQEILMTGKWLKETGRQVASLYLGGGTPTILSTPEISNLLQWIRQNIPWVENLELSVEAGRPDTLSKEKLQALHEQGVNRLSINPQTMHDRTLQRIGRAHSVEDVLRIYELAREISNWTINMDLILGLPGETVEDVRESLEMIGELKPDNLTVHALAIKRGSKEHEAGSIQSLSHEFEQMQEIVLASARAYSLQPYYLYRQKHIAGNLENIGFARPGLECRYNIGIMEERQSVIGIGAGASSKAVNPVDYSLVNFQHPANWRVYLDRWPEIHERRVSEFLELAEKR